MYHLIDVGYERSSNIVDITLDQERIEIFKNNLQIETIFLDRLDKYILSVSPSKFSLSYKHLVQLMYNNIAKHSFFLTRDEQLFDFKQHFDSISKSARQSLEEEVNKKIEIKKAMLKTKNTRHYSINQIVGWNSPDLLGKILMYKNNIDFYSLDGEKRYVIDPSTPTHVEIYDKIVSFSVVNQGIKLKLFFHELNDVNTLEEFYYDAIKWLNDKLEKFKDEVRIRHEKIEGIRIDCVRMPREKLEGYLYLCDGVVDFVSEKSRILISLNFLEILERDQTNIIPLSSTGLGVEINGYVFTIRDDIKRQKLINFVKSYNDKYIYDLNKRALIEINEFTELAQKKSLEILSSEDGYLYHLYSSYLVKYLNEIFLSVQGLRRFESFLIWKYGITGSKTLIYHEDIHNKMNITSNIKDSYEKLISLIIHKGLFQDEAMAAFVTWLVIRNIAIQYYFKSFLDEYAESVHGDALETILSSYLKLDFVRTHQESNIVHFIYFLIGRGILVKNLGQIEKYYQLILKEIDNIQSIEDLESFESGLMNSISAKPVTIDDIDLMSGLEFEAFVSILFTKLGYRTELTKSSGDQGIDVIAEKNGVRIGIQAKCYSSAVPNKAIQQVVAGLKYYKLDKGIVLTNNFFTASAIDLAYSNNIVLWDRIILVEKLKSIN